MWKSTIFFHYNTFSFLYKWKSSKSCVNILTEKQAEETTEQEANVKTAGIIAEYNPFHNGHQYQMETVRHLTGADFVIVAMSGDFMQRGVPAIADKYTRTRMALLAVPIWYSNFRLYGRPLPRNILLPERTASRKTGVVDTLCYGCETPEKELMQAIVEVLSKNASDYQMLVSYDMKQGNPFPAARSHALCSLLPSFSSDAVSSFLASPNNILALEYEKAIARWNSINSVHDRTFPVCRSNVSGKVTIAQKQV